MDLRRHESRSWIRLAPHDSGVVRPAHRAYNPSICELTTMNRRRLLPGLCLALFVAAFAAASADAQSPATGSLEVRVEDVLGAPLSGVQVLLTPVTGGPSGEGVTDRAGVHPARLLVPGTYDLLVERLGFRPVLLEGVPVRAGRTLSVRLGLERSEAAVDAPRVVRYRDGVASASRPGASRT
jgi:hypothetical protein